jgi:hypothetical protein
MRLRMLVVSAVLVAVAAPLAAVKPAQAGTGAAGFKGIVVAKQKQRGTLLIARAHGAGLTVRGGLARAKVGERVKIQGVRLHDGTIRMRRLHVLGHVRRATVRGTVLRSLARGTLVASGRSVVLIHRRGRQLASASDHGGMHSGDVEKFRIRFDDNDDVVQAGAATQVGQADTAKIEGRIVSLSPFVVSLEGLPITITVPAGMTLPASLAVGDRIELTVQVGANNTFTLVAIDEQENDQGDDNGGGDGGGDDGGGSGGGDGGGDGGGSGGGGDG